MKISQFILYLSLSITFFLSLDVYPQTIDKSIISQLANEELHKYLNQIPLGQEQMFGFNNREEFSKAEIGVPYEVYTLNSDFFNDEIISINKSYVITTNNWRVPVVVDNQNRALLTISKYNNNWAVVKLGATGLANELEMFEQNNSSSSELKILRVFQITTDFILTNDDKLYPLPSAKKLVMSNETRNIGHYLHDMLLIIKSKINVNEK